MFMETLHAVQWKIEWDLTRHCGRERQFLPNLWLFKFELEYLILYKLLFNLCKLYSDICGLFFQLSELLSHMYGSSLLNPSPFERKIERQ